MKKKYGNTNRYGKKVDTHIKLPKGYKNSFGAALNCDSQSVSC